MQRTLTSLWSLTVASCKMYFRNRAGIFFTMFIPVVFIVVFGLLSKGDGPSLTVGLTNQSQSELAKGVVKTLEGVKYFKVTEVTQAEGAEQLSKGKIDLQVVIPAGFGARTAEGKLAPSQVETFYNKAKPQNGQTANLIIGQVVSGLNAQVTGAPTIISVNVQGVQTANLTTIDFILPGILAISIMQLGIFSVAFAFVSLKTTGALRRIQATPTHPMNFIFAQSFTRLLVGVMQVILLTGLGIWLFNFHLNGSPAEFLLVALMGVVLFLGFGFAVAGAAKDENSAAPIANLITFPMLFLSGTFFPRDAFPSWLERITDFFPLTYLADALRRIANEGAHLTQLGPDLLGMTIWGIIIYIVAVRVFRWE